MSRSEIRAKARSLMPGVVEDLSALVSHASVSFPGFPAEPVLLCAAAVVDVLKRAGADNARLLEIPHGYPAVYAEVAGPPGAPTVLMYGHYDVQPAPVHAGWDTDPWTATLKEDGRLYGRGAADNKSGVVIPAACLSIFDGKPPVTIKIVIEGEEETMGHLEEFVEENPELFACDVFVIADMGNQRVGEPIATTTLRGDVSCRVEVQTLDHQLHSGRFGGPTPDALMALIRMLDTLLDDDGSCAVPDAEAFEWPGADMSEAELRDGAAVLPDVELIGAGSVASRLWSKPSVNVLGIDAPSVVDAANILIPKATAVISMRIAPGADAEAEREKLMAHLRSVVPWNARVNITPFKALSAFAAPAGGPALAAALDAGAEAFGRKVGQAGSGGSIPLLNTLMEAVPGAEFVLWGAEDMALSRIHGSDESVDLGELENCIVAQALLVDRLGALG